MSKFQRLSALIVVSFCFGLLSACSLHYYGQPDKVVAKVRKPIYKVRLKRKDTASKIAKAFDTTVKGIKTLNAGKDVNKLKAGDIIFVSPGPKVIAKFNIKTASVSETVNSALSVWPAKGWVTSGYGMRRGRFHHGLDIAANYGSSIWAAADGKVVFSGWKSGYGRTVVVDHGAFKTLYAHCSRYIAKKGQIVKAGDVIAKIGNSGNARGTHLHFEYRQDNNVSRDPLAYLPADQQLVTWIYYKNSVGLN